jgi:hypothetical protein
MDFSFEKAQYFPVLDTSGSLERATNNRPLGRVVSRHEPQLWRAERGEVEIYNRTASTTITSLKSRPSTCHA